MAASIFYLEFCFVLWHYLRSLELNEAIADWVFPLTLTALAYFYVLPSIGMAARLEIVSVLINVVAILIGFSITSLTVLATASGPAVDAMKNWLTEKTLGSGGHRVNLHRLLHITASYTLLAEIATLVVALLYRFLYAAEVVPCGTRLGFAIAVYLTLHILVLNVRNLTNFYLVFTERKRPNPITDKEMEDLGDGGDESK